MTAADPLARALGDAVRATDLNSATVDELASRLAATARAFNDRPYLSAPEALERAARALSMDDGDGPDHYDTAAVGSPRRQDLLDRVLLIIGAAMGTVTLEEIGAHHGYYPGGRITRLSSEGVDNPVASVTLHDRTPAIDDGVTYAEERAAEDAALAASWTPGDRYVWTSTPVDPDAHARVFPGSAGPGPRLELRGVVVDDPGAGQMLTVRHDGETDTALVYRDQLTPERDRG